nr:hypothetical protein [Tanacetum cinerariifolium]
MYGHNEYGSRHHLDGSSFQPNVGGSSSQPNVVGSSSPIWHFSLDDYDFTQMYSLQFSESFCEEHSPVEEIEEIQVLVTQKKTGQRRWVCISEDSIKGNMRKDKGFWIEILKCMQEICPITQCRTYDMVNGKWKTMRLKVCTFYGVYANTIRTDQAKRKMKAGSASSASSFDMEALAKMMASEYVMASDSYNIQKNQEMSELLKIKKQELELKAAKLEIRRMENRQRYEALYEMKTDEALKERLGQRLFG